MEKVEKTLKLIEGLIEWNDPRVIIGKRSVRGILRELGILNKQGPDLTTPDGFLEWATSLSLDLSLANDAAIAVEIGKLRPFLIANWPQLTQTQINENLAEMAVVIQTIRQRALGWQEPILELTSGEVFDEAGKDWARRYGMIAPTMVPKDRVASAFLVGSTMNFLRARDGRILSEFTPRANNIVANALNLGLGREDIGLLLEEAFGQIQSSSYYKLVAGQFLNRARSYSALRSMQESDIELAEIAAVLDSRTTDICRYLDGSYIEVDRAIGLVDDISRKPASIDTVKDDNPWIREGRDDDGRFLFVEKTNGERTVIARVKRSGVGTIDDRGEFTGGASPNELQTLGIGPPPYHGFCRTTLLPVVD